MKNRVSPFPIGDSAGTGEIVIPEMANLCPLSPREIGKRWDRVLNGTRIGLLFALFGAAFPYLELQYHGDMPVIVDPDRPGRNVPVPRNGTA